MGELAEADSWRRTAAATGDGYAMLDLASHLQLRDRATYDPREVALWLELAAATPGYMGAEGAWRRGQLDESGLLGCPDDVAAILWYRRALATYPGYPPAKERLDALLGRRPDLK